VRVSSLARIAATASGICLTLAGLAAGLARAEVAAPGATAASLTKAESPDSAAAYFSTTGRLAGVAAASPRNAWAVGYAGLTSPKVLMLHWNGKTWSRVTGPRVLTGPGQLNAITVVNAKDAWAAGYTGTPLLSNEHTLLLHWNGSVWKTVTRPAPIPGFLDAVAATASGGWAVGGAPNGHNWPHPLALRLSGTSWSRVPVPLVLEVTGVAITGTHAAWAIGATEQQSKFAHWNGRTWTWEFSITPVQDTYILGGIAAGPRGTAFTVGYEYPNGGAQVPVSLKLTGSTWKKVPVKAPAKAILSAVSFAPGGAAWAAGSAGPATLTLRWNGTAWARVASPSPGSNDMLDGLGFSSARDGWAVGSSGSNTLILHWTGSAWK
jgi:hypothetical protein